MLALFEYFWDWGVTTTTQDRGAGSGGKSRPSNDDLDLPADPAFWDVRQHYLEMLAGELLEAPIEIPAKPIDLTALATELALARLIAKSSRNQQEITLLTNRVKAIRTEIYLTKQREEKLQTLKLYALSLAMLLLLRNKL